METVTKLEQKLCALNYYPVVNIRHAKLWTRLDYHTTLAYCRHWFL